MTCKLTGCQGRRLGTEPDSCHVIQTAACLIPPPPRGTLAGPGPRRTNPSRMIMRPHSEQEAESGDTTEIESDALLRERTLRSPLPLFWIFSLLSFFLTGQSSLSLLNLPALSLANVPSPSGDKSEGEDERGSKTEKEFPASALTPSH